MKLIIGLGNPGSEYENTRHNFGFAAVDSFAEKVSATWIEKPKFHARVAEFSQNGEKIILAKPQTFYNLVGQSARAIRDFYKLTNTDILVIHDEIDIPIGTLRTRIGGSAAGNNGVKSLIEHIGDHFARLRIGSGTERAAKNRVGHVLSAPSQNEVEMLIQLQPKLFDIIDDFIDNDFRITSFKLTNNDSVVNID